MLNGEMLVGNLAAAQVEKIRDLEKFMERKGLGDRDAGWRVSRLRVFKLFGVWTFMEQEEAGKESRDEADKSDRQSVGEKDVYAIGQAEEPEIQVITKSRQSGGLTMGLTI